MIFDEASNAQILRMYPYHVSLHYPHHIRFVSPFFIYDNHDPGNKLVVVMS